MGRVPQPLGQLKCHDLAVGVIGQPDRRRERWWPKAPQTAAFGPGGRPFLGDRHVLTLSSYPSFKVTKTYRHLADNGWLAGSGASTRFRRRLTILWVLTDMPG